MTTTINQKAPGCFGAASVYGVDSKACQGCVGFAGCGDASMATLQSIRETIDVRDILAKHENARLKSEAARKALIRSPRPPAAQPRPAQPKPILQPVERQTSMASMRFEISADDQYVLANISAKNDKAGKQAIIWCKANKIRECREELPQGRNPFAVGGSAFMRVACDMLISGGFTRASLKDELMRKLDWTDGTAGSHVSMIVAILASFKLIEIASDRFVIRLNRAATMN